MQPADERVLRKVIEEIDYLQGLLKALDEQAFLADQTAQRAAAMTAINIGELAKHLSDAFYRDHPDSELRYAAKTRDVYAHGYFTLSFATVHKTAIEDYPRLRAWIQDILDGLADTPSS